MKATATYSVTYEKCDTASMPINDADGVDTSDLNLAQQWRFYPSTGRHKIHGFLQNVKTGQCLGRSKSDLFELSMENCSFPVAHNGQHGDCTQLWAPVTLNSSRYLNRVESETRIKSPLAGKRMCNIRDFERVIPLHVRLYKSLRRYRGL